MNSARMRSDQLCGHYIGQFRLAAAAGPAVAFVGMLTAI